MTTEYKVIESDNLDDCQSAVQSAIADGWSLHGGVSVSMCATYHTESARYAEGWDTVTNYAQALIRLPTEQFTCS